MERLPSMESAHESTRKELESLRARAAQLEAQLKERGVPQEQAPSAAAQKAVNERWAESLNSQEIASVTQNDSEAIHLQLAPEAHDAQMQQLVDVLQEKGVAAAIRAAEGMNNLHIADDFHRILTEWVHEGLFAKGADAQEYKVPLSLTLYEVTLPQSKADEKQTGDPMQAIKTHVSVMEQLYRGLLQLDAKKGEYFSIEIANPVGAVHTSMYIAVPRARKSLFEKQIAAQFPHARLQEAKNDYNPFAPTGVTYATKAKLAARGIYSLRTIEAFHNDPMDVLLNAFSRLNLADEGAAIQFIISPYDRGALKKYRTALQKIRTGVEIDEATDITLNPILHFAQEIGEFFSETKKLDPDQRPGDNDARIKNIEQKVASPIVMSDIRIVASAQSNERTKAIVEELESSFQQFSDTAGNSLEWDAIAPRNIKDFSHLFSFRLLDEKQAIPLSCGELAALIHVPRPESHMAAPEIKQDRSASAGAPLGLPQTGTLLGVNRFRGVDTNVYLLPEDRVRHLYVIGQTGTGKSHLLKNLVIQDIRDGAGVCFVDPHGSDVLDILSAVPPERADDVIYFDPAHIERPIGLNMLEYDPAHPEQKTLVVDELFGIFKKLFGAVPESMGPAFEQYFRNAALLVMEDPSSGNTLVDIGRIFSDPLFRARKLAACRNPIVKNFWEGIAMQASGEQSLENYGPYVTNKFDVFTTNEFVRPIISQQRSAFNFREIMDNKKILLVNLAKGRIGDVNANLLGLVIIGKFLIAALSRADSFGKDLPPFYLHIDEFQNFTTPSIATILSEARKYKLCLTVAHQFIAQLSDEIRDAVFGNVGSLCAFRVGADDAEKLQKQFDPVFTAGDLIRIENFHAHVRLLVKGQPNPPFSIATLPFESGPIERVAKMQELSFLKYGRPREEVETMAQQALAGVRQEPSTLATGSY